MRKLLATLSLLLLAAGGLGSVAGAGGLATGYTLNFTSATVGDGAGDTDLLIATLTGGDCDTGLRLGLFRADDTMVTDNGDGGVVGATQIALTNPGSLVTEPGNYIIRVTCGGIQIGGDTPFEVLAQVVVPPDPPVDPPVDPPTPPGPDVGPIEATPASTG